MALVIPLLFLLFPSTTVAGTLCGSKTCNGPEACVDGECMCGTQVCKNDAICWAGNNCLCGSNLIKCPTGEICLDAKCVPDPRAPSEVELKCGRGAHALGGKCYCFTNSIWSPEQCTPTQDCDYYTGCECKRRECKCGNTYCNDANKCDPWEDKCQCGGGLCNEEEECFFDMCMCDRSSLTICSAPTVCKNKQCHCGSRPCTEHEKCFAYGPHFCFCGNYLQQCGTNEVCSFDGTTHTCKCGNQVCKTGETCEIENNVKTCKCGGTKCTALETCTPLGSTSSCCTCGTLGQCKANEICGLLNNKLACKCGNGQCQSSEVCMSGGTCVGSIKPCVDQIDTCSVNRRLCTDPAYANVMATKCPLTCNKC